MPFDRHRSRPPEPRGTAPESYTKRRHPIRAGVCIAVLAGFVAAIASGQVPQPLPRTPPPVILPDANRLPDANDRMMMREQQDQEKSRGYAAANVEPKKQIADDTALLLKLAGDLKAEVDITNKDTLSLDVIRRADEIESLAHCVKEKMKLSAGAS